VRRRSHRTETFEARRPGRPGRPGRLGGAISRHPREFVGIVMATVAIFAVALNALVLQKGPHPAPIFATQPLLKRDMLLTPPRPQAALPIAAPSAPQSRWQLVADIQRELTRKGFYDGAADGIWGAKTDAAARDFVLTASVKINAEASDELLRAIVTSSAKAQSGRAASLEAVRGGSVGAVIALPKRVLAIQRALADFGYGQIKSTGVYDSDTRSAIERFELDRQLPVTGQISDRFVRELAAMTGRPLE
jgi:peptidoglycan hydrolase-like protein with peptidoglycan-binding domain